jgi:hypothetical protein
MYLSPPKPENPLPRSPGKPFYGHVLLTQPDSGDFRGEILFRQLYAQDDQSDLFVSIQLWGFAPHSLFQIRVMMYATSPCSSSSSSWEDPSLLVFHTERIEGCPVSYQGIFPIEIRTDANGHFQSPEEYNLKRQMSLGGPHSILGRSVFLSFSRTELNSTCLWPDDKVEAYGTVGLCGQDQVFSFLVFLVFHGIALFTEDDNGKEATHPKQNNHPLPVHPRERNVWFFDESDSHHLC